MDPKRPAAACSAVYKKCPPRFRSMCQRGFRLLVAAHLLVPAVSLAFAEGGALPLPFRAFRVEGGSIWIQSGATRDPELPPGPFGNMRYPVRYFLVMKNETGAPVWADIEWRLPDDKPKTFETKVVGPGEFYQVWRRKFGLICDEPIPVQIRIHADAQRKKLLKAENVSLRFPCEIKEPFLQQFSSSSKSMIVPGWPEMSMSPDEVPGSAADVDLQRRVQYEIWREESKDYPDCVHKAVRAEGYQPSESANLSRMSDTQRQRAELARGRGSLRFERWLMKSCEQSSTYEVAIMASPEGKTELRVEKIPEAMPETNESQSRPTQGPAAPTTAPPVALRPETPSDLFDGRGWRVGYEVKQSEQEIIEYVLPGETVGNWTELLSIQTLAGAQVRLTPEEVMLGVKKATLKKCPKTTWKVIRQSSSDVFFEWQTEKCRGVDNEYELELIFRSDRGLHHISYASRKIPVSETQRAQWTAIIEKLAVSGSPP